MATLYKTILLQQSMLMASFDASRFERLAVLFERFSTEQRELTN